VNPTADRVDGVDELRLLECTDAAEWGAADLSDVLRQLDEWLARLEQNMEAGMPPPQGLHADGALARQADAIDRLLQDCRARWARQWAALQPAQALALYGQQLADQSLREVVLHQLQPKDLALADGLGVQPESITVTSQGLVVRFGNKPRP